MELLFDIVSVAVAKGRKAEPLRYCSLSVYVSLKDTLSRKFTALNSGQLFNPGIGRGGTEVCSDESK